MFDREHLLELARRVVAGVLIYLIIRLLQFFVI